VFNVLSVVHKQLVGSVNVIECSDRRLNGRHSVVIGHFFAATWIQLCRIHPNIYKSSTSCNLVFHFHVLRCIVICYIFSSGPQFLYCKLSKLC